MPWLQLTVSVKGVLDMSSWFVRDCRDYSSPLGMILCKRLALNMSMTALTISLLWNMLIMAGCFKTNFKERSLSRQGQYRLRHQQQARHFGLQLQDMYGILHSKIEYLQNSFCVQYIIVFILLSLYSHMWFYTSTYHTVVQNNMLEQDRRWNADKPSATLDP